MSDVLVKVPTREDAAAAVKTHESEPPISPTLLFTLLLVLGCSYAFNGLDRSIFPALLAPINKEFGLSLAQGGFLSNIFTLNIAIFGALAGWFMLRVGRKWTLVGGLIFYSAFTLLIPLAHDYATLAFFRAMTGAGEALHIAAIYSILGAYFGSRRGTFLGINNAFFGVGTFFGPFVSTHLFAALGSWRPPFYLFGLAGIAAAVIVIFLAPRRFTEKEDAEQVKATVNAGRCPDKCINTNTVLCIVSFFLCGYSFLSYMALYSLFLRDALGYSVVAAGTTFSMYGAGALTALFGGWLGEKLRRYALIIALAGMAGSGFLMFDVVRSMAGQMILSFIFGAMLSGILHPRYFSVAQRSVQPRHIGTIMSIMIPVFYLAGFIAGPAFGALVPLIGWSSAGVISVTVTAGAAALITCFISPSRMRGV
jgi:MFS family permease